MSRPPRRSRPGPRRRRHTDPAQPGAVARHCRPRTSSQEDCADDARRLLAEAGAALVLRCLHANAPDDALAAIGALERHDDSARVHNLKGGVLLARQDVAGARASFAMALARDPLYLPALDNLAQLDVLEQRPADASRRYRDALAKAPRSAPLMAALARLACCQGNGAEALDWLERAWRANPACVPAALRLADAYVRAGDSGQALLLAQQLQLGHPENPDVVGLVAQLQALRGDLPAAAAGYARLAQLMPASARPQLRLAAVRLAMRDEDAALAALQRAAALDPDLVEPRQMLLQLLAEQQQRA